MAAFSPPDGPRAITDADFPEDGPVEAQLAVLVNWAVLAPSVLNTQPWRFQITGDTVRVFVDRARQLRTVDPEGREARISCGAALFTLRLAARHYGFAPLVGLAGPGDEPDLVGTLRLAGPSRPSTAEEALFHAIRKRRTNRDPFASLAVPAGVLARIRAAAEEEGVALRVLGTVTETGVAADLVGEAVRVQGTDPATVDELRAWLRPTGDRRADGVPDDVQGGWDRLSYLYTEAPVLAAAARRLAREAPALLLLATDDDTPSDWARTGMALQHILLLAEGHGLAASYFNQPTEVPGLRRQLSTEAGVGHAQVLFRLGTPIEAGGTPRRPVRDVLLPDDDRP